MGWQVADYCIRGPRALARKQHRKWNRKNKRVLGRSIDERPAIVDEHEELGHWEADTVVGKRQGKEAVVFTMVERVTDPLHCH